MFVLKKRKYTWFDMIRIPFSCVPLGTLALVGQKSLTALANVFQVVVVAQFLDGSIAAVVNREFDRGLIGWFVAMLLIVSWKRVSYNVGVLASSHMMIEGHRQVRREFTKKRDRLEYYLLEDPETEELANRLIGKDLAWTLESLAQCFVNFFCIYIPRTVGVLLIIATQVWWLALVVIAMAVPLGLLSLKGGRKLYSADKEAMVYERRHKYLFDVLTGRETVEERSLFGYSGAVNGQWHRQYETARKINMKASAQYQINMRGASIITCILASIIVLIMIPLTVAGDLSMGLFISLSTSIYDLVQLMGLEMTNVMGQMARYREYMKDLTVFAALPERQEEAVWEGTAQEETMQEESMPGKAVQEIPPLEELEFKNVTFRYPGSETYILKGLSLKLKKGVHYAIVGENGAGKSTLIKLLTGLYRDYQGEILYNGIELRKFSREEWFKIFSCVFQDFARYYLSVEENICLGAGGLEPAGENRSGMKGPAGESKGGTTEPGATEESAGGAAALHRENEGKGSLRRRMVDVSKELGIHEAISALSEGYGTRLGKLDENSVDLSGGQWQRVAMARALMNDAPLLLLDEPTAALDPISESRLYEEFGEISKNRTTVFISHRLGSTKLSNHIFVIKDGCVAEQGSHEELMSRGGFYAEMYETQQSWYKKEEGEAG